MIKPCIVIPVYNHERAIVGVVDGLRAFGVPCILVDDGSSPECARVLDGLAAMEGVSLVRLAQNCGKGAAVLAGFNEAAARGYSHVLQIDADGQHDVGDIPVFLKLAQENPQAIINGRPIYDESVPKARLYGRYATHIWVWINTLSLQIHDSMCGFRVYPVAAVQSLQARHKVGVRMNFDTDILVRLYWDGLRVINQPTRVAYPSDGVSHFRVWADNVQISLMHARLFFGMLPRIARLIARHFGQS